MSTKLALASDAAAAPLPYRAADFGGRDSCLLVADGYASDRFSLVPASSVSVNAVIACDALEPGFYRVAKLGAKPVRLGDFAGAAAMVRRTLRAKRVELVPLLFLDDVQVHARLFGRVHPVFVTPAGVHVAVNVDHLPVERVQHESFKVRGLCWRLTANAATALREPLVFTRIVGRARWQALVMPVLLPPQRGLT